MAEKFGFFDSNAGDRTYLSADFSSYFANLVSNGIFYASPTNLQVAAGTGMAINVAAGSVWINGRYYENTDSMEMIISTANGTNPRIDRVVVRLSMPDRAINLAVLTGAPSTNPAATALTRTSDTYELGIADILIPASSAAVAANNITDTRLDPNLSGLVNSLITAIYE
jgi:hypothetical protein